MRKIHFCKQLAGIESSVVYDLRASNVKSYFYNDVVEKHTGILPIKQIRTFRLLEGQFLPTTDKGFPKVRQIVELCSSLVCLCAGRGRKKRKVDEKGEKCIQLTDVDFKCAVSVGLTQARESRDS